MVMSNCGNRYKRARPRIADLEAHMLARRLFLMKTTALGAAWLAGHYAGIVPDQSGFADIWRLDRRFEPHLSVLERQRRFATWKKAVRATISMTGPN